MYCKNCENIINEEEKFCKNCGVERIEEINNIKPNNIKQITKKSLNWAIVVVIIIIAYSLSSYVTKKGIPTIKQNIDGNELTGPDMEKVANEINKKLPMMTDPETRLDSVFGGGNYLNSNYTFINLTVADFEGENFDDKYKPEIKNTICSNPKTKIYIDNKIQLNLSYYDKDGFFIAKITINTGTDC